MSETILRVRRHFYAAHHAPYHDGACQRLHGHRYEVIIDIHGPLQHSGPCQGMIADFAAVKEMLDEVLPDHMSLNPDLPDAWEHALENATCELLAGHLFVLLNDRFQPEGLIIDRMELQETPECSVVIKR